MNSGPVRPSESFHPRKILKQAIGFLAVERFVGAEQMRVAAKKGDRPVIALQLIGQSLEIIAKRQWPLRQWVRVVGCREAAFFLSGAGRLTASIRSRAVVKRVADRALKISAAIGLGQQRKFSVQNAVLAFDNAGKSRGK